MSIDTLEEIQFLFRFFFVPKMNAFVIHFICEQKNPN